MMLSNKPFLPVAIGIFCRNFNPASFQVWTQLRGGEGPLKDKWEFPGGKLEPMESPMEAMIREIAEETTYQIRPQDQVLHFMDYSYETNEKSIVLFAFLINSPAFKGEHGQWLTLSFDHKNDHLQTVVPDVNLPLLDELIRYLKLQSQQGQLESLWNLSVN